MARPPWSPTPLLSEVTPTPCGSGEPQPGPAAPVTPAFRERHRNHCTTSPCRQALPQDAWAVAVARRWHLPARNRKASGTQHTAHTRGPAGLGLSVLTAQRSLGAS